MPTWHCMKDYEEKEFELNDNFILYALRSHTNNMFIHNLFGCLTQSQTIYNIQSRCSGRSRLLSTYTRSHIYTDTRRILTHSRST